MEASLAKDSASISPVPFLPVAGAPDAENGNGVEVLGMSALMGKAKIPVAKAAILEADVRSQGAVHVRELSAEDWKGLSSWNTLLCFEQRRLIASLSV